MRLTFILSIFLVVLCAGECKADKRIALVVGNSRYQNVAPLNNPRNDATLMAETLRGAGFTLVGNRAQLDLDKTGFDRAVQDFGSQLIGANVALFYYSGHGMQIRGENYLVPISANPTREADVDFQMLNVALVLREMEGSGTKLNIVILDACRNNPFGGRGLRGTNSGLAQIQGAEGTLISFATQPGNVAQDGDGRNSPFTQALAETIRKPGLEVLQTFNQVGLKVVRATGGVQIPWNRVRRSTARSISRARLPMRSPLQSRRRPRLLRHRRSRHHRRSPPRQGLPRFSPRSISLRSTMSTRT